VADPARQITPEDLRAAVAAGIVTESQAASVSALADSRTGKRLAMPAEDEPFEFFRGFSEIFVSIGLLILWVGIMALVVLLQGGVVVLPLVSWWLANYFTLKRRMNLPSMVLTAAFGIGVYWAAFGFLVKLGAVPLYQSMASFCLAALGMAAWYRRFRLPFSVFVLGLLVLGAIYSGILSLNGPNPWSSESAGVFLPGGPFSLQGLFDLKESPQFAWATLGFGIAAFIAAMWFDTRDPHRLGRYSATAFWLHILAAPALVNPVALTLWTLGNTTGMLSLATALAVIAVLALVIDRRSFLTAALVYIALLIGWVIERQGDGIAWALIVIALGGFVTALGTWWVPLRSALMRALPDFPGKRRLPPYAEKA
jgi:hypothetical protein